MDPFIRLATPWYLSPDRGVFNSEFYEGAAFAEWRHNLFVTSLRQEMLLRLVISGKQVMHQEVVLKDLGRLRDIGVGPDGYIYLAVNFVTPVGERGRSFQGGRIVRLIPAE